MRQIKHILHAVLTGIAGLMLFALINEFLRVAWIKEEKAEFLCGTEVLAEDISTPGGLMGKRLFEQYCASCHALDKVLNGLALRGVVGRGPWAENKDNLVKWIKNPAAFISTDQYTQELRKAYGGQVMPGFGQLSDEEIEAVIQFISTKSATLIP